MATRFRLPSTGTAAVSPAVQTYTHTGTTRRPLPTTTVGDASALTTSALAPDAADDITTGDTFFAQFVSDKLAAGLAFSTAQTVKFALQCLEANAGNNLFVQLWVGVYNEAGTTLQATLRSKTLDGLEINTTIQNRTHSVALSGNYTTVARDRLVVEISVQGLPVASGGVQGHNASLRFGSNGAGGDLAENDTDAGTTTNPWIEFSADLTLYAAPAVADAVWTDAVGYWPLNELADTRVDYKGMSDLAPSNAPGTAVGKQGNALSVVAATSQSLWCLDNATLSLGSSSLTVAAWVYIGTKQASTSIIAGKYDGTNVEYVLYYGGTGVIDRFQFVVYTSGGSIVATANTLGSPATGTWYFVVGRFNLSTLVASISVDLGAQDSSAAGSGTPNDTGANFSIGASGVNTSPFDGRIDEVGIWKRQLTATEGEALFNDGNGRTIPITLLTGLRAYWKMDEASGTRYDTVGSEHLTDVNTVGSVAGLISNTAQFVKANSEYLYVNDDAVIGGGDIDFTFNYWIRWDVSPVGFYPNTIGKDDGAGALGDYSMYWDNGAARFRWVVYNGTRGEIARRDASVATDTAGTWYMITMDHSATTNTIGVRVNGGTRVTTATGGAAGRSTRAFRISGDYGAGNYFSGQIDEVGYWKRSFTDLEATQLFNSGAGIPYPLTPAAPATRPFYNTVWRRRAVA